MSTPASEPPVTQKRGRGRPRKVKVVAPPPEPTLVFLPEEPATNFTELHHIDNSGLNLEDIKVTATPLPKISEEVEEVIEPEQVFESTYTPPTLSGVFTRFVEPEGVEEESDEERKEKREILMKLKKYQESFEIVRKIPYSSAGSLAHLRDTLDEVRSVIQNKNTAILLRRGYLTAVSGLEAVGKGTGILKLDGLSNLLSQSEDCKSILDEMACEVCIGYVEPYKKLAFVTMSTAFVVDSINRRAAVFDEFAKTPAKAEVVKTYADL